MTTQGLPGPVKDAQQMTVVTSSIQPNTSNYQAMFQTNTQCPALCNIMIIITIILIIIIIRRTSSQNQALARYMQHGIHIALVLPGRAPGSCSRQWRWWY